MSSNLKNGTRTIMIRKDDIITIMLVHLLFVSFPWFPFYQMIKYILLFFIGVFVFLKYGFVLKKKNTMLNILIVFYTLWVIFSSYMKLGVVERNTFAAAIMYGLTMLVSIMYFEIQFEKNNEYRTLKIIAIFLGVYVVVSDVLILLNGGIGTFDDLYFVGNKFLVSYDNLIFICFAWYLFFFKNKKINLIFFEILAVFSAIISSMTQCSTGVVGSVCLLIMLLGKRRIKRFIQNPKVIIALFVICFLFVFWYPFLLALEPVKWLIVDVLGEDLTLTSRTNIFLNLPRIVKQSPLFGYGYGSTAEIMRFYTGCTDTQNGLWEIIVSNGIIGGILYTVICFYLLCSRNNIKSENTYPFICYSIIMIILSSIEITYGILFIVMLVISHFINCKQYGK